MSALGDYIHLYRSHYYQYGVTRKSKGNSNPNYSMEVINNRIKSNIKPISKQTIAELERKLKLNSDMEQGKSKTRNQQQKQRLINIIYEILYERSKNITGAKRVATMAQGGQVWYTNKNKGRYTKNLGNQSWATDLSHADLKARSDKANNIYRQIQRLITKINKTGQAGTDFQKLVLLFNEYTHLAMDPNESTMGAIKSALSQYRYKGAAQDASGNFGQMMVAICDETCSNLAEEQVKRFITEAVVGGQTSEIKFDKSKISTGYHIFDTNPDNQNQYSLGSTQNKVDVQININDEDVFATVKATADTDSPPRPRLQDVDLLIPLTFLNSYAGLENFGNHWLNMHVAGDKMSYVGQGALDDILKKEIAYEALTSGNPFKQDVNSANTFVYINRATGQVYVKTTQQLLDNMDRIGGLNNISQLRFRNQWQPQIWQRINDILKQVHATKIHVAMNINFQ